MRALLTATLVVLATSVMMADTPQERLKESADVFSEVMKIPEKGIPQDLLAKAQCVIIIPNMKKAAFVVGGEFGRGFAECRKASGIGLDGSGAGPHGRRQRGVPDGSFLHRPDHARDE